MNLNCVVGDIETYPNCFQLCAVHVNSMTEYRFEISSRRNDSVELIAFLNHLKFQQIHFVGFNSISFDYIVLHHIIQYHGHLTVEQIYSKAQSIFDDGSFKHMIWPNKVLFPQIDLFKINHFDNKARSTSLKALEFNMRSESIQDLPYKPGVALTHEQMDPLMEYCAYDVAQTLKFYHISKPAIDLRFELNAKYGEDFTNFNDTKIGKEFFTMKLEEAAPGVTGTKCRPKNLRQTIRREIVIADIIFQYVNFHSPEFQSVLDWFRSLTITETKGHDTSVNFGGVEFFVGLGGIHASVEPQLVKADEEYCIVDVDVTSYYPSLAIANRVHPEHLGETFCDVYDQLFQMRKSHPKGTPENDMLKLALNGVYGDSNNKYSCFFDSQYTMTITINGQLLLMMLAETFSMIHGLQLIQANTDGITVKLPRRNLSMLQTMCEQWENFTCLQLESVEYSRMFIRDVNNYIGEYTDGKLKRKGAYEYDMGWHQDQSALVVKKAVEAYLIRNIDVEDFILNHADIMDFMLRVKVPRTSKLRHGTEIIQNTTRYYISTNGQPLTKLMPPTKQMIERAFQSSVDGNTSVPVPSNLVIEDREISVNKDHLVTICNDMSTAVIDQIDYSWYMNEAEKLIKPMRGK